jgi:hypothetical protein
VEYLVQLALLRAAPDQNLRTAAVLGEVEAKRRAVVVVPGADKVGLGLALYGLLAGEEVALPVVPLENLGVSG